MKIVSIWFCDATRRPDDFDRSDAGVTIFPTALRVLVVEVIQEDGGYNVLAGFEGSIVLQPLRLAMFFDPEGFQTLGVNVNRHRRLFGACLISRSLDPNSVPTGCWCVHANGNTAICIEHFESGLRRITIE